MPDEKNKEHECVWRFGALYPGVSRFGKRDAQDDRVFFFCERCLARRVEPVFPPVQQSWGSASQWRPR